MPAQALIERYRDRILGLLPPGPALTRVLGQNIPELAACVAVEPARLHERAINLFFEAVPPFATELLSDWERTYGLPTTCYVPTTIEDRRAALLARLVGNGGHGGPDYLAIALSLGYETVTFEGYAPFVVDSSVDDLIYDDGWAHAKRVIALGGSYDALLKCEFNRRRRAHTAFHFVFFLPLLLDGVPLLLDDEVLLV
jgi:uncharacterized protein YmfQ (DUF2313 family)